MKPIWIVDDDQSIRFVLEKALLREDLPTRSFTNPREVLLALENATDEDGPQILVSDIRMPGGSGLELLAIPTIPRRRGCWRTITSCAAERFPVPVAPAGQARPGE